MLPSPPVHRKKPVPLFHIARMMHDPKDRTPDEGACLAVISNRSDIQDLQKEKYTLGKMPTWSDVVTGEITSLCQRSQSFVVISTKH